MRSLLLITAFALALVSNAFGLADKSDGNDEKEWPALPGQQAADQQTNQAVQAETGTAATGCLAEQEIAEGAGHSQMNQGLQQQIVAEGATRLREQELTQGASTSGLGGTGYWPPEAGAVGGTAVDQPAAEAGTAGGYDGAAAKRTGRQRLPDAEMKNCPLNMNYDTYPPNTPRKYRRPFLFHPKYYGFEIEIRTSAINGVAFALLPICEYQQNQEIVRVAEMIQVLNSREAFVRFPFNDPFSTRETYIAYIEHNNGQMYMNFPLVQFTNVIYIPIPVRDYQGYFTNWEDVENMLVSNYFFMMHQDVYLSPIQIAPKSTSFEKEEKARGTLTGTGPITFYTLAVIHGASQCFLDSMNFAWCRAEVCTNKWYIHGLWCDRDYRFSQNRHAYCELLDNRGPEERVQAQHLERYPNVWESTLMGKNTVEFVDEQWCRHGMHMFSSIDEYIERTVQLYNNLDIERRMNEAFNFTHYEHYTVQELKNFLDALPTHRANIDGFLLTLSPDYVLIRELLFCFDASFAPVDCKENQLTGRNLNMKITFPSEPVVFPHVMLSLVWSPTIKMRLSQLQPRMRGKGSYEFVDMRWKLHSFCPATRYETMINQYRHWRRGHLTSFWSQLKRYPHEGHILANLENNWPFVDYAIAFGECGLFLYSLKHEDLQNPLQYLTKALNLYTELGTSNWYFEYGRAYTRQEFLQQLNANMQRENLQVILECATDNPEELPHLAKIRFCLYDYEPPVFQYFDCPAYEFEVRPYNITHELWFDECGDRFTLPEPFE